MTTVTIQDATDSDGFTATIQDEATAITPLTDSGADTSGGDDIYELAGGALELATIVDRDDGTEKDVSNIGTGGGSALEVQEDGTSLTTSATLLNIATGLTATEPATDEIQIVVEDGEVDHDALLNYAAAEHFTEGSISHDGIDQTTVSSDDHHAKTTTLDELTDSDVVELITTTAANLPAAGTVDRIAFETDTGRTLYDNGTSWVEVGLSESEIDHDALVNFVANEHVDHSTVNITAGTLLTGGGDITASRTLNVDEGSISHDGIDQTTVSANDHHQQSVGETVTASGDGATTVFTLTHSLGTTPAAAHVQAASEDASTDFWVSNKTSTNVEITYAAAPASGTDNLAFEVITHA